MMLSIIIPTLNEEKVILKRLMALEKLSLSHEIIVTDDRSTDKTIEIAKQHADTVIERPEEQPRNIAANGNRGTRAAHGDFFVFMDADSSIPNPDEFFKRALADFEKSLCEFAPDQHSAQ